MKNIKVNTKDLISRDLNTRKDALFKLILFTGRKQKTELLKFYQTIHSKQQQYCFLYPLALLNREKKISSTKDVVYPYLPRALFESTQQFSFLECLKALTYMIQLKDDHGKFIYYKSINNICRIDRYPDVILCEINNVLYYIQYCPSVQINEYNKFINARDKKTNTTNENIRRILVSDDELKSDDVKVNGITNIITIDENDKIEVIR